MPVFSRAEKYSIWIVLIWERGKLLNDGKNGNLLKVNYANGDYIRYQYDSQDRLSITWKGKTGGTEEKLYSYVYNKQGEPARVTIHEVGKTYFLYYDLLGRLMRVYDSSGCSYEYTYDAGNNMTAMRYSAESSFRTGYTYDKDSRETKVTAYGHNRSTVYDAFGRVASRSWDTTAPYHTTYQYMDSGNNRYGLVKKIQNGAAAIQYTYDANGNFTRIREYAYTTASTLPDTPVKTITGTYGRGQPVVFLRAK